MVFYALKRATSRKAYPAIGLLHENKLRTDSYMAVQKLLER